MNSVGSSELRLRIGDVTVSIRSGDEPFMRRVQQAGERFVCEEPPAFVVSIDLDDGPTPDAVLRALFSLHHVEAREVLQQEELRPHVHISDAEIAIHAGREIFDFDSPNRPRLVNVLLCAAYNTVCERHRAGARNGFLIHGCGIEAGGGSILFSGHSGAGKTTLAGLAGGRPVLNDETVLIAGDNGGYRLFGTPFVGGVEGRSVGGAPLEAIYFLEHGEGNSVTTLAPGEAFQNLLCQLFQTAPLAPTPAEHRSSVRARADAAAQLVGRVPVRRLSFVPDERVWELVESVV